jgi:hypothetical protein
VAEKLFPAEARFGLADNPFQSPATFFCSVCSLPGKLVLFLIIFL